VLPESVLIVASSASSGLALRLRVLSPDRVRKGAVSVADSERGGARFAPVTALSASFVVPTLPAPIVGFGKVPMRSPPAGPVAGTGSPFGPCGSAPALKSCGSSEPSLTFALVIAFRAVFDDVTAPLAMLAVRTLFFLSVAAA
jgi:hypothetical protein